MLSHHDVNPGNRNQGPVAQNGGSTFSKQHFDTRHRKQLLVASQESNESLEDFAEIVYTLTTDGYPEAGKDLLVTLATDYLSVDAPDSDSTPVKSRQTDTRSTSPRHGCSRCGDLPEALRNADQERILVKSRIIVSSHGTQACGGHQPNYTECIHYCSSTV